MALVLVPVSMAPVWTVPVWAARVSEVQVSEVLVLELHLDDHQQVEVAVSWAQSFGKTLLAEGSAPHSPCLDRF